MAKQPVAPTGNERHFGDEEIIVSKTDLKGRITYANDVFQRISGYNEPELLGAPHSLIRHPGMPRSVFKLLWERIAAGEEIFAYVNNLARNGDNYWVLAHVTPTFGAGGEIVGYHSNRRTPDRNAIEKIAPLYEELVAIERGDPNAKEGLRKSSERLAAFIESTGMTYDELMFAL